MFPLMHHAVKTYGGGKVRLHATELRNVNRGTRQRQKLLISALFKGQYFLTLEGGNETSVWNYHSNPRRAQI